MGVKKGKRENETATPSFARNSALTSETNSNPPRPEDTQQNQKGAPWLGTKARGGKFPPFLKGGKGGFGEGTRYAKDYPLPQHRNEIRLTSLVKKAG